ncbi:response regulator [Microbacterium flavum]|uniref:Response regulator n=1 Tax=Microbacterium flavum TaxID=415216 RepID=A0ABS5XR86_9MICO|nr:response regulator [Microbacterium flavum]MBT8797027.1 response regulator [Microbacterium flavum]
MAIARLHGGPLDGQVLPLDDETQDSLILPYSETQLVYERGGALENTGEGDGPTSSDFHYVEAEDDINPDPDGRDE